MNHASFVCRLLVPVLLAGCGTRTEVSGVESFCVEPIDGPNGPQLEVSASLDTCVASCDSVVESQCTLTEIDGALQVEASAIIKTKRGDCTAECGAVVATCRIPVSLDESYIVRGDDGDEVEIDPAEGETVCTLEPI